jgi:hypothetical protein
MAHFAKVVDGKVTQVIVAEPEFFETFIDTSPGHWIQTSYNATIRNKFAAIGDNYDHEADLFYPSAPVGFPSWTLNRETWVWEAPVANPNDGKVRYWDEAAQEWKLDMRYPENRV